jgi:hypothetical protein
VALVLPWLCGCIWIHWLLQRTGRCNVFIVVGQGFFLGFFIVSLVIRLWGLTGAHFHFWGIAAVVAVSGGLGIALQGLRPGPGVRNKQVVPIVPAWHLTVATVLVALIAWRYVTLAQELLLRPLYAWDAWMNWAPKAIVWLHHGTLVNFVDPQEWLLGRDSQAYTLGNAQANGYPITVPLIQLWGMWGAGTWDHSSVFLPWLLAPIALGLALYGHLRLAGVSLLWSVIACYLLLSLPYLNVHAALAGYADIWLAAVFCLAVCALYEYRQCPHWGWTILWLLLALLCAQLKNPGIVLGLIVLVFGVRGWLKLAPALELAAVAAIVLLFTLAMVYGVDLEIPYLGRIAVDAGTIEVGRFGQIEFAYHSVGSAFLETLFVMFNWNLLWYLSLPYVCYCLYRGIVLRVPSSEFLPVLAALAFVGVVFVFSRHYLAALSFTVLNRVLLYCVPAMIFCMFLSFQRRKVRT